MTNLISLHRPNHLLEIFDNNTVRVWATDYQADFDSSSIYIIRNLTRTIKEYYYLTT
jgi:hypothetical protein